MIVALVRSNCKCGSSKPMTGHYHGCPLSDLSNVDGVNPAWYTVARLGTPKRDGGEGVRWTCTCTGEKGTCRHLRALFAGNVIEVEDRASATGGTLKSGGYYTILTTDGIDLLKPTWATRALKEAGEAR